jgi:hypothetical protein
MTAILSNGHDLEQQATAAPPEAKTQQQEIADAVAAAVDAMSRGEASSNRRLVQVVIGFALTVMGSSAAGVYSLVSQAEEISRLPGTVDRITTVLVGESDELGQKKPGLIERFEDQSRSVTQAVETLTMSVETLSRRMDQLESSSRRIEANTVPNPPEEE